ncbi:MAG: Rrf2 family transcriptional regulator [Coriobacteriia bacterium]|nr:Rrf2 family transcriptional regulator [Coriobacteriia bacterium]
MRVSQRLDYTLRGLTSLAERPAGTFLAAGEIADSLSLPRRFVEQQFTALARAGLVECRRGAGGGCALARPASEISVGEVVRAVQGSVLDVPRVTGSAVSEMWADSAAALDEALEEVTIEELATRQRELDAEAAPMYYI